VALAVLYCSTKRGRTPCGFVFGAARDEGGGGVKVRKANAVATVAMRRKAVSATVSEAEAVVSVAAGLKTELATVLWWR
jgi:hypothetical protein